jgi:penicillin-binding protein A
MHDFKHFSRKKSFSFLTLFRGNKSQTNSFKALRQSKQQRRRLSFILPCIALLLASYPLIFLVKSFPWDMSRLFTIIVKKSVVKEDQVSPYDTFRTASELLSSVTFTTGANSVKLADGRTLSFTINPNLQQRVLELMVDKEVPYAVFVAIEPKTGKVLALAGHSTIDSHWGDGSYFRLYPMASLFKIITAAAALEQNKIEPSSTFVFTGYSYSEDPRHWNLRPGKGSNAIPLSLAMGKSINPVFGSLASEVVGKDSIMSYAHRFGFNQTLFPGTPIVPSRAIVPVDDNALKLMGAGLGREVKISPLHAAVIMAALANQGTMMAPTLINEIRGADNSMVAPESPVVMKQLVKAETADQLEEMLLTTVTQGTSRRAFHDRQGRPKLGTIRVAAKTGSINGTDPVGYYTWFAAYAPVEDPKIALVALIINQDKWKIKASHLGEFALEHFFTEQSERRQALLLNSPLQH